MGLFTSEGEYMYLTEHNKKINEIFNKVLYWKMAAFGTLCIQQEYQIYEQLAQNRFWDMSTHLKKSVNRFWRAVATGFSIDDKYLMIIEESFFEPRDAWEEMALQIVCDIKDFYYAVWKKDMQATLDIGKRQFTLLEKYCVLTGNVFEEEHPLVRQAMEQQVKWAEELVAVSKLDKKSFIAELPKRDVPPLLDSDLSITHSQMPKEKKAKKKLPELRYMSRYVEEGLKGCIEEFEKLKQKQENVNEDKQNKKETKVDKYHSLIGHYEYMAKMTYVTQHDKQKTLEYYSLAAYAARDCIQALRDGHKAVGWYSDHINVVLEDKNKDNLHYYIKSAILTGKYDIALDIVTKDSLIGAMLLGEDERAKTYLPEDFEQIGKYDRDWDGTLWAIIHKDEKLMNNCIKEYIKTLRWQAKNFDQIDLIAEFSLPLIRLAQDRGMKCTIDVYELPLELLDD